jgi:hypothetical protein
MSPDNLRKLSWRLFKAIFYCGIAGILIIIAVPNPGFRDASGPVVRILATIGFGLLGLAFLSVLLSLITGAIAWIKGSKSCGWIIICALFLLAPMAVILASWLNL